MGLLIVSIFTVSLINHTACMGQESAIAVDFDLSQGNFCDCEGASALRSGCKEGKREGEKGSGMGGNAMGDQSAKT